MNTKTLNHGIAAVLLVLVLSSCGFPLGEGARDAAVGSISLLIEDAKLGSGARTLAPDIGGLIAEYHIRLTMDDRPDVDVVTANVADTQTVISGLAPGPWSVTVSAHAASGTVLAEGTAGVEVSAGVTKAVRVVLAVVAPDASGPGGNVVVIVKLPENSPLDFVTMPDGDDEGTDDDKFYFDSAEPPWEIGEGVPDYITYPGVPGDLYLDLLTSNIYKLGEAEDWVLDGKLASPPSNGMNEVIFVKTGVTPGSFMLSMTFYTDGEGTVFSQLVESVLVFPNTTTTGLLVFDPVAWAFVKPPAPPSQGAQLYYDEGSLEFGYPIEFTSEDAKLLPVDHDALPPRGFPILTWTPAEGVYAYAKELDVGYTIQKSTDGGSTFSAPTYIGPYESSYEDGGWVAGPFSTIYRIIAFNKADYEAIVDLTQPAVPENPAGISVNLIEPNYRIYWDEMSEYGTTTYNLYAKDENDVTTLLGENIGIDEGTSNIYTFSAAEMLAIAGKTYSFTVSALYDDEESDYVNGQWDFGSSFGSGWNPDGSSN